MIGKVQQNAMGITIVKPVGIGLMPTSKPGDQGQLAFMPFIPLSAEEKIDVAFTSVMFMYEPNVEILNLYNQKFGTGIIVSPKPNLRLV